MKEKIEILKKLIAAIKENRRLYVSQGGDDTSHYDDKITAYEEVLDIFDDEVIDPSLDEEYKKKNSIGLRPIKILRFMINFRRKNSSN